MLTDPPIDELIQKAGCKYSLACAVGKRANDILKERPDLLTLKLKATTLASKEFYEGKVEIKKLK